MHETKPIVYLPFDKLIGVSVNSAPDEAVRVMAEGWAKMVTNKEVRVGGIRLGVVTDTRIDYRSQCIGLVLKWREDADVGVIQTRS